MVVEQAVGGDLGEDQEGGFAAVADFGCEADFGEGVDELDERGFCFGLVWVLGGDLVVDYVVDAGRLILVFTSGEVFMVIWSLLEIGLEPG